MGRWTGLLAGVVLSVGCAEGGGPDPGGTGRMDGGGFVPRDGAPDTSISTRPDTGTVRVDAGAGCPDTCMLAHASSSCVADRCVIDACDPGFDDCDGEDANGCETALDSPDHCGACETSCVRPHAAGACMGGTCGLGACDPGFGDCDGDATNGCETSLDSAAHCGACDRACSGGAMCVGGSCGMSSCPEGTSNCDADETTGCEVDHSASVDTCASAENLGSAAGDTACGFLCPAASFRTMATRQGRAGAWFRASATECSSCPADIYHCYRLEVPAGVDYDLLAYGECGSLLGSLPAGPGETEEFCLSRTDDFSGGDDSFDYWLEVRHRSGASCIEWRLTVESTDCSC